MASSSIFAAVLSGSTAKVQSCLRLGADVNLRLSSVRKVDGKSRWVSDDSPLLLACELANLAVIQMLLEHEADVNATRTESDPKHSGDSTSDGKEKKKRTFTFSSSSSTKTKQRTSLDVTLRHTKGARQSRQVEMLVRYGADIRLLSKRRDYRKNCPALCYPYFVSAFVSFAASRSLKHLDLSNCKLTTLPSDLFAGNGSVHPRLQGLEVLNLNFNKLTSLPKEIAGFKKLRELHVERNELEELPLTLVYLRSTLKWITASRNPRMHLPPTSVVEKGATAILDYLTDMLNETSEARMCVKLVVCGNEKTGKSSLLRYVRHCAGLEVKAKQQQSEKMGTRVTRKTSQPSRLPPELPALRSSAQKRPSGLSDSTDSVMSGLAERRRAAKKTRSAAMDLGGLECLQDLQQQGRLSPTKPETPKRSRKVLAVKEFPVMIQVPATVVNRGSAMPSMGASLDKDIASYIDADQKDRWTRLQLVDCPALSRSLAEGPKKIAVHSTKLKLKTYKSCFTAAQLVEWLMENQAAVSSRADGLVLGDILQKRGFVRRIGSSKAAFDGSDSSEYMCCEEEMVNVQVSVNAWDLGSDDVTYPSHRLYLTNRSLYVLTFDMSKPLADSNLSYWLEAIYANTNRAGRVFLVGTHLDKVTDVGDANDILTSVQQKYARRFPSIVSVVAVSSVTTQGFDEFIELLKAEIKVSVSNAPTVPAAYAKLEDALAEEKAKKRKPPVLTWSDVVRIATPYTLTGVQVERALQFLHNNGTVFYWRGAASKVSAKDRHTESLVILSPKWISSCVVRLGKAECVERAMMLRSDTPLVWPKTICPPDLSGSLIALLHAVEVVFPVQHQLKIEKSRASDEDSPTPQAETPRLGERLLVPHHLPVEKEHKAWRKLIRKEKGVLGEEGRTLTSFNRIFELSFLPPGLCSRLIALLMPQASRVIAAWRSGMVLCIDPSATESLVEDVKAKLRPIHFYLEVCEDVRCLLLVGQVPSDQLSHRSVTRSIRCVMDLVVSLCTYWYAVEFSHVVACPRCLERGNLDLTKDGIDIAGWSKEEEERQSASDTVGWPSSESPRGLAPVHLFAFSELEKASGPICCPLCEKESGREREVEESNGEKEEANQEEEEEMVVVVDKKESKKERKKSKKESKKEEEREEESKKESDVRGREMTRASLAPDTGMTDLGTATVINSSMLEYGKTLGEGAYGMVRAAKYLGRPVAVKEFLASSSPEALVDAKREIVIMSQLTHPNLVNLIGYTLEPVRLVMDLADKGDLYSYIHSEDRPPISWPLRLRIIKDIADGMKCLHSASPPLVHRDVKSPNILSLDVNAPVLAKVADFGLSWRLYHDRLREPSQSRDVQTPFWLPPEILEGREYTEKADCYALGMIMWEMLTCAHPFAEFNFKFSYQCELKIADGLRPSLPPPDLSENPAEAEVRDAYVALLQACWQQNPAQRPSCKVICNALQKLMDHLTRN